MQDHIIDDHLLLHRFSLTWEAPTLRQVQSCAAPKHSRHQHPEQTNTNVSQKLNESLQDMSGLLGQHYEDVHEDRSALEVYRHTDIANTAAARLSLTCTHAAALPIALQPLHGGCNMKG